MSLNERDYARQRGWGQPDRVPLPAECMGPEELVAIATLREHVRSGRYGDDVMADHDLRRLQWGRYLVENGHIGEGSAEHGEDVQETSHEDDSRTA